MKRAFFAFGCFALFAVATLTVTRASLTADEPKPKEAAEAARAKRLDALKKLLDACTVKLADAIKTAETATGGRALAAEHEMDDTKAIIEVKVLLGGEKPGVVEVEIDAKTGQVIPDDDDDDDDDEDDDDDHDDDKGGKGDDKKAAPQKPGETPR